VEAVVLDGVATGWACWLATVAAVEEGLEEALAVEDGVVCVPAVVGVTDGD
jgi:hypothetical protein